MMKAAFQEEFKELRQSCGFEKKKMMMVSQFSACFG
jgi:hypothetical protein